MQLYRLALTSLALALLATAGADAAPRFPAPPDARVESVADDMVYNGTTMSVRKFETDDSVEQVLEYYRRLWRDSDGKRVPFAESEIGDWRLVTRDEEGYLMSVRVQPLVGRGAWGYLGLSDLPASKDAKPPELGKGFPSMRGSTVLNDIFMDDPGKKGRVLLIQNGFSGPSNASFYRGHFQGHGWTTTIDQTLGSGAIGHVLAFRKGRREANLVIRSFRGDTSVVVNTVEHGLID